MFLKPMLKQVLSLRTPQPFFYYILNSLSVTLHYLNLQMTDSQNIKFLLQMQFIKH